MVPYKCNKATHTCVRVVGEKEISRETASKGAP